jgi:non-heme chloroperoxidase
MRMVLIVLGALLVLAGVGLAAAIGFGGPAEPVPLPDKNSSNPTADLSDLPPLLRTPARDGTPLAYRLYAAASTADLHERVVLIHGSSSRAQSMHAMAKGLAQAGYAVVVPDVRGHGITGAKGKVSYIGQLEDDLEDLVKGAAVAEPRSLVGFSAGGGFTLRFAADRRASMFAHYVLLAPFLGPDAATYRPASGGWVSFGLPRALGLVALNQLGITAFNDLPVNRFALPPEARNVLTPQYSYALWANFRPHRDQRANIAAAAPSMAVVVGADDEQFYPERFATEFAAAGRPAVPITIVAGTGHLGLIRSPAGVQATANALAGLSKP